MSPARDHSGDPEWLRLLHEIPRWRCEYDETLVAWLRNSGITAESAETAATSLVSKWDGKKYVRADMTFRNWAKNEQARARPISGAPALDPNELIEAYLFTDDRGVEPLVDVGRKPRREVDPMTKAWHPPEPTPQIGNGGVMGIAHKGRWRPQDRPALPETVGVEGTAGAR